MAPPSGFLPPTPAELAALRDELEQRTRQLGLADARVAELRQQLAALEGSTFWRLTAPARKTVRHARALARLAPRMGRKAARAGWWLVTGQLPTRVRLYRQHRQDRAALSAAYRTPPFTALARTRPNLTGRHVTPTAPLRFPRHAHPTLSIIIPSYGQVPVTLRCLESIARHPPSCPYEVIVAEDASGDPDVALLAAIEGLVLREQPVNLGFLRNSNDAARNAGGTFLHFLNNDTEVRPDTFDALLRRMASDSRIGLTGSRLLYPDGRLQEAGGIVWNDASGCNIGRNDPDPDRAAWLWPHEADYISGASILLPRALFEQLGGFDEIFAPAYYEDTDLAFRVRQAGYRVMYEPASTVIHHEGLSHGTDETSGIKAHQARNRTLMLERWKHVLETEHFPPGTHMLRATAHARHRRTMLIIDHYVPEPDRDAGSRATLCVIDALVAAGWLVKFWPALRQRTAYAPALEQRGVEILDETCPAGFEDWIAAHGEDLDHVMIMRPIIARHFLPLVVNGTTARRSYYGHDIHFLRMMRETDLTGDLRLHAEAEAMQRLETWLWRQFDAVLYLSGHETALVREMEPAAHPHTLVPFCFPEDRSVRPVTHGATVLFVGGFAHPPNIDAALWLVRDILPLVRAVVPDVRLVLAGSNPSPEVRALAGDGISVTGSITESALAELYATARAAAVPLRFGAGVKNKVLEAFHHGLPLVTTPIGAEGIAGADTVCAIATDAAAFAHALIALLKDDALWRSRSDAGKALIARGFSPARLSRTLLAALEP